MPVTCYLCGRDFGKTSIGIHLPVCKRKFQHEQKTLPPGLQCDLPEPPANLDLILSKVPTDDQVIAAFNDAAKHTWNKLVLVGCDACGR